MNTKTTNTRTNRARHCRILFVIEHRGEDERWKDQVDTEEITAFREQIVQQMAQEVPVIHVPAGLVLWTRELGEMEEIGELEKEAGGL